MESINEIIDSQTFCQQLVDETSDFLTVGQGQNNQQSESECEVVERDQVSGGIKYIQGTDVNTNTKTESTAVLSRTMQIDDSRIYSDDESRSVVMVIDEMGHASNVQTTYQIVPQPLQLQGGRTLPLIHSSLLPVHQGRHDQERDLEHNHDHVRLAVNSPVDFVGTDISLDGLTVNTSSQIVIKQEHKMVIVNHGDHGNDDQTDHDININRPASSRIDMSSMTSISAIDELSSDNVEEVTLNQHHQQLLEEQQQHHHHHQHQQQHHQQYGNRLEAASEIIHHQQHQRQQQQQQRPVQLGIGHHHSHGHRETLSVIVPAQDDDEDIDEDVADDDDPDSAGHLLSPALGVVDNSLEHSTYQTLTSVNNHRISPPDFSPTSYATLTPIQPLPPISTMSDKFAYAGHISVSANSSGSGNENVNGNGSCTVISAGRINGVSADGSSNDCGSFTSLPMPNIGSAHQGLSLGGLGVGVQSPYSSYDKLPSLISPPHHNYASSPSHGMPVGIVGSCELHNHSSSVPSPIPIPGAVSGSHSPHLQDNSMHKSVAVSHQPGSSQAMHLVSVALQKQVICLSPSSGIGVDGVVGSDYESSYSTSGQHEHELIMAGTSSTSINSNSTGGRSSQLQLQHSPTLSPHSVSGGSVVSMSLHSPHINGTVANLSVELPVVDSLTPTPPPGNDNSIAVSICVGQEQQRQQQQHQHQQQHQLLQAGVKHQQDATECNTNNGLHLTNIQTSNNLNVCNLNQQQQQQHHNGLLSDQQQAKSTVAETLSSTTTTPASNEGGIGAVPRSGASGGTDMEEINTKELAQRISAELKRYSIPQAIFAQRVLCRSQGTLSDLLRNPKPWSKLKSGRETFRRMFKWLQEPEFQRMSALRLAAAQIPQRPSGAVTSGGGIGTGIAGGNVALSSGASSTSSSSTVNTVFLASSTSSAPHVSGISGNSMGNASASAISGHSSGTANCRRKEEPHIEQMPQPKKPRLVFTDLQRRTLQAIFKETKRPSKEMQVTIARQLGLEPTTVGNFFMNARRRSMDKWRDDDSKNSIQHHYNRQQDVSEGGEERESSNETHHGHYGSLHTTAMSPLGNFDDEGEMDLELDNHDFLVDEHDDCDEHDDML